jgi:DNA phosphorothioation-dependent restriction protein DptH
LDYSPEFAEGLGHRLLVTTTWRDEIGVLLARAMNELGFLAIDQSVRQLLHHLKMISGRLALQALDSNTTAASAVGLGAVSALLQSRGRLRQAVLLPVDLHPRLFSKQGYGSLAVGERRCDLVLVALKRNIVEATFIEVKWRRGNVSLDELGSDMLLQMEASAEAMRERFFEADRIDGSLQRAYLANVLRFYFERAQRYDLFQAEAEASFLEHLSRLEKTGLQFRPSYEGFVVSLDQAPRRPFQMGDAKITVLTAEDFEDETQLATTLNKTNRGNDDSAQEPPDMEVGIVDADAQVRSPDVDPLDVAQADGADSEDVEQDHTYPTSDSHGPLAPIGVAPVGRIDIEQLNHSEIVSTGDLHVPLGEGPDGAVVWSPSTKGSPHLFIIGIPGQGKSWTVSRILGELGAQGVPALVLDFHGQFADPESRFMQQAAPVVLDAAAGLPFSPFECSREPGSGDWKVSTFAIAEIFAYVVGLGDMQRDVVYTAVKDAYIAHGFADPAATGQEYPTLEEVLTGIEKQEQERRVSNVTARCRPLLEMDLFRPGPVDLDLLTRIRGGLVIDLHNLYVETLQLAAGAFVLRKVYRDMFRWGTTDRLRLAIVLDEAHRLARDITLPKIMKEGRKFGIAVIVASQGMSDFHQDVLANAGTKIIFRTNYPESRKIAGFIRARQGQDLPSRIEQLTVGSAYVQTPDMPFGTSVKMYPLEPELG